MVTDTHKKKTSRLALASLCISFCVLGAGVAYVAMGQEYWDSLHTNHRAGGLMGPCGTAWFFLSVITFVTVLGSISRIFWSKGKVRGFAESIVSFLIIVFTAGIVSPTLGLAHPVRYRRVANNFVYETTTQTYANFKNIPLSKYDIEVNKYTVPKDEPRIVEVIYTLKEKLDSSPYPQKFSVLLNFDTGEKSIKQETPSEE